MRKIQRQNLEKLFPELNKITDENIKQKVIDTYLLCLQMSSWNKLEEVPFLPNVPEASQVEHTRSVTQCAISVAEIMSKLHNISFNMNYLIAGALLHDVGKLIEYTKNGKTVVGKMLRHPFTGGYLALKTGLPKEIVHIIATHSFEGDTPGWKRSPEAIIVHFIDIMNAEILTLKKAGKSLKDILCELEK